MVSNLAGEIMDRRRSAEDLLETGLKLLEKESVHQLTIDALCKRLGVTKGSFYHHFKNRADFLERMLEHWVNVWTISLMEDFDSSVSAQEKYNAMIAEAVHYPMNVEISIRAWAQHDMVAGRYLKRVDEMRIGYLRSIFSEICGDKKRADQLAKIDYMLFVGSRMISPPIMGEEILEVLNLLRSDLYHIPFE